MACFVPTLSADVGVVEETDDAEDLDMEEEKKQASGLDPRLLAKQITCLL